VWAPPASDVNKLTFTKFASPQRYRRDAATASSRRYGSAAVPYGVLNIRSTILEIAMLFLKVKKVKVNIVIGPQIN